MTDRLPHLVMKYQPCGKRSQGRPPKRYVDHNRNGPGHEAYNPASYNDDDDDLFNLLSVGVEGGCFTSSHSDTSHLVRLLLMSDRPVAKTSICTKHNTDKRQTFTLPAGIEPAIQATKRPHIHALDSAADGIDGLWASEADFRSTEVVSYVNNPCT
jgi:hypothetical protein